MMVTASKINIADGAFPSMVSATAMFDAIGVSYTCFDVDDRPRTIYVDYNTLRFDRSLCGTVDVVSNAGTTEHLGNPNACFFLMHECCRVGGLLLNNVPVSGYANHGLNNLTPKFWHTLRWMNACDVVNAQVDYLAAAYASEGNVDGEHLRVIKNLDSSKRFSGLIEIHFGKRKAAASSRHSMRCSRAMTAVKLSAGLSQVALSRSSSWGCLAMPKPKPASTISRRIRASATGSTTARRRSLVRMPSPRLPKSSRICFRYRFASRRRRSGRNVGCMIHGEVADRHRRAANA
jgi:hypothetical protein